MSELNTQDRRSLPSSRTLRPPGSGPTARRQQRIRWVLERRQPDLTVVLEDVHDLDLTRPTALVFGNEMRGLSAEAIRAADGAFRIPMMGMVESLNVSVACAVTLYEALRQCRVAGMYDHPSFDAAELGELQTAWLKR